MTVSPSPDHVLLLADIGSTFTKVVAVDRLTDSLIGTALAPTTVATDVRIGLRAAIALLEQSCDRPLQGSLTRVSSSAAGGLRMVAVGFVPGLTALAARYACLGAGARVLQSYAFELSPADLDEINRLSPEILLLAGGTDGGDRHVILYNARALAGGVRFSTAVLVAGNETATAEAQALLKANPLLEVETAENVLPRLDRLNLEPARDAIRGLFLRRIAHAKGIDRLSADGLAEVVMPTPEAVLHGAELLSRGTATEPGLGDLIVLDIGGATTDVHSIGLGPGDPRRSQELPEPFAKRTVEGDLGLRYNAAALLDVAGSGPICAGWEPAGAVNGASLREHIARVSARVDEVPQEPGAAILDGALAVAAGGIALGRHAGRIEQIPMPGGPVYLHRGKDLTGFPTLIGTGGVFARGGHAAEILAGVQRWNAGTAALTPRAARTLVDRRYLLFAAGLLKGIADDLAVRLVKRTLVPVGQSLP